MVSLSRPPLNGYIVIRAWQDETFSKNSASDANCGPFLRMPRDGPWRMWRAEVPLCFVFRADAERWGEMGFGRSRSS